MGSFASVRKNTQGGQRRMTALHLRLQVSSTPASGGSNEPIGLFGTWQQQHMYLTPSEGLDFGALSKVQAFQLKRKQ